MLEAIKDARSGERIGNYMLTSAGQKYFPHDPRGAEIDIQVIAHHLANVCRWGGATQHPTIPERMHYSVAEHSVHCSYIGPEEEALERLMHDAAEGYIGDLIRPLKYDASFHAPFLKVEAINERAIADRFGLTYPWPESVKIADEMVCDAEWRQIIPHDPSVDWSVGRLHDDSRTANITIEMWEPFVAKTRFLERFHELYAKRANG